MTDVQNQGYSAYYNNVQDCPYSNQTEHDFYQAWIDGWLKACDEDTDCGKN